jgi:hypothetical protein
MNSVFIQKEKFLKFVFLLSLRDKFPTGDTFPLPGQVFLVHSDTFLTVDNFSAV